MNRNKQELGCGQIVAVLLWIGTWVLMIPIPRSLGLFPEQLVSAWGIVYLTAQPVTRLANPADNFIADHSFYIGLLVMLLASGIVILAGNGNRRVTQVVAVIDAVILAIWLLVSWPWN